MWHDVETTTDLLNFQVVADTAAQLIRDSCNQPISIGVSGNWGTGKSSLVKMIGESLQKEDVSEQHYLFIEFNAWLYQGYDDARFALLQSVSDKLLDEAKRRESNLDKALSFAKSVNWLRIGRILAPAAMGAFIGGAVGGPLGTMVGAVGRLFKGDGVPSGEDLKKVKDAYSELQPELKGLLKDKEINSLPKEISGLRDAFEGVLEDLNITLVVLVDDLDRCLPNTAISTLEAMRLLLFLPRTAFIIAADEEMIRNAVRTHFGGASFNDDLVTSYFDKLIQVPMRVPRLGVTEVKAYLMLLLADLAERQGEISIESRVKAQCIILKAVRKSWAGGLTKKIIEDAFGEEASKISTKIDIADQLAGIMATADHIAGNPRLIKRFLNNLMIRNTIAKAQGMTLSFEELVKMQLFERCASPAAFDFLAKQVAESDVGKPDFLRKIEDALAKGKQYKAPDNSWDTPFLKEWVKINPTLANVDLRPLLHLSRDKAISLASYDEMSSQAQELLSALLESDKLEKMLVQKLKHIGELESERILSRLARRSRADQFDLLSIRRALHVPVAFPKLASLFIALLSEIPHDKRKAPLIPLIKEEPWAQDLLVEWGKDENSPTPVKNAINKIKGNR